MYRLVLIALGLGMLVTEAAWAARVVQPADVYARVATVRAELELLRVALGRSADEREPVRVTGAAPREVFFQAMTLYGRADRLAFEHLRTTAPNPRRPHGEIQPRHVLALVDASLARLRRVKRRLGVTTVVAPAQREARRSPSDVFRAIVQANRQLNLLLEHRHAPGDVFEEVTRAVGYAARLLARYPGSTRIPDEPRLEARRRPEDVYSRLVGCLETLRKIADRSGIRMLTLEVEERDLESIGAADAYDVARLLVSELAFLHERAGAPPLWPGCHPGEKGVPEVYRRAGVLEAQLVLLARHVEAQPERIVGP